jgi:beta-glucosidase
MHSLHRRDFLRLSLAMGGGLLAAPGRGGMAAAFTGADPHGANTTGTDEFAPGVLWGAATSAYQIEGAWNVDGRGESIWDRFSHTPGKVKGNANGDVACDSYHRYREDIAIARQLGMKTVRFSIAWPRIQPNGRGAANPKGLDFYKRYIDALLEAGIRPFPTLFHWDLPQALEDAGGWPNRDTAHRLADYAQIVTAALGDRVRQWTILNEPYVFTVLGYGLGIHTPGRKEPLACLRATHVANLAQGLAFRAIKGVDPTLEVGAAISVGPTKPLTSSDADRAAAERQYKFANLWFVEPALKGHYPDGVLPAERLHQLLDFRDGDEKTMRAPLQFLGLNYYMFSYVRDNPDHLVPGLDPGPIPAPAMPVYAHTDFGWPVYPQGLHDIVVEMAAHTGNLPIEITENGAAYNTAPGPDGRVRDEKRIAFARAHLQELARAIRSGAPVRAYHHWSLLDNFEWAEGYTQRFGLVYVDFEHGQKRIPKDSAAWYAKVIAANRVV